MKKRIAIIAALVIALPAAAAMFDYQVGARGMGIGGANTAAPEDIDAVFWNPAALGQFNALAVGGTYFKPLVVENLLSGHIGAAYAPLRAKFGALGAGMNAYQWELVYIERSYRIAYGYEVRGLLSSQMRIAFGIAGSYNELTIGGHESLEEPGFSSTARSFNVDLGIIVTLSEHFKFAAAGHNIIASQIKLLDSTIDVDTLQPQVRAALAYAVHGVSFFVEFESDAADTMTLAKQFHLGAEYWIRNILAIRLGYNQYGLCGGLGFRQNVLRFDAAFAVHPELGLRYQLGFRFDFSGLPAFSGAPSDARDIDMSSVRPGNQTENGEDGQ